MRFEGRVYKDGKQWLVELPMLDAMSQGRTKKEALTMAADLVESLVNKPEFKAQVHPGRGEFFELSGNSERDLIALLLRRQREKSGLSLAQVAQRLGVASKNTYARYEQGLSVPSIEKLSQLLGSVMGKRDFTIAESRA